MWSCTCYTACLSRPSASQSMMHRSVTHSHRGAQKDNNVGYDTVRSIYVCTTLLSYVHTYCLYIIRHISCFCTAEIFMFTYIYVVTKSIAQPQQKIPSQFLTLESFTLAGGSVGFGGNFGRSGSVSLATELCVTCVRRLRLIAVTRFIWDCICFFCTLSSFTSSVFCSALRPCTSTYEQNSL